MKAMELLDSLETPDVWAQTLGCSGLRRAHSGWLFHCCWCSGYNNLQRHLQECCVGYCTNLTDYYGFPALSFPSVSFASVNTKKYKTKFITRKTHNVKNGYALGLGQNKFASIRKIF